MCDKHLFNRVNFQNGLLVYSYNSAIGSTDYIGVDIVDGRLRLSASLAGQGNMNLQPSMIVNNGDWYQLQVDHRFRVYTLIYFFS